MREAEPLALDQRVHRAGEADGVQRRTDDVDARRGSLAPRTRRRDSFVVRYSVTASGTMLTPEDPAPVQRVDQHAAEQRTDHERRARPRRPRADGACLIRAGEPGVDHRQRAGHQERGADALQAAGGHQHPAAGRHRAQHRRHREDHQAHPQHRQPAELIGDRPCDEDQRAEGQQVAVHHPLLQRQAATEFPADRRQRQVDHRAVQKRHERGQHRDRDERPVGSGAQPAPGCPSVACGLVARSLGKLVTVCAVVRVDRALGGPDGQIGHQRGHRGQRPAHRDAGDAEPARLVGVVEVVAARRTATRTPAPRPTVAMSKASTARRTRRQPRSWPLTQPQT